MAIQLFKIWDGSWKNIVKPYYWNGSSWVACNKKIAVWEDGWVTVWQPDPNYEYRRPTTSTQTGVFDTRSEDFSGNGSYSYYNTAANLNRTGSSTLLGFSNGTQTYTNLTLKADSVGASCSDGSALPSSVGIVLSTDGGSSFPTTLFSANSSGVSINLLSGNGYSLSTGQTISNIQVKVSVTAGRIGGDAQLSFSNLRTEGTYY